MELLLPAIITILTQVFKKLVKLVQDEDLAKSLVVIFAFFSSTFAVFTWKYFTGDLNFKNIETIISTFFIAVGYYELLIKRVINPMIDFSKTINLE